MAPEWNVITSALAARRAARLGEEVPARAAVALVLRDGQEGIELLFIRRAEHPQDPWSGQMAFPGGRAEPADADLRATAVRETREEIGLDLDRDAEFLGELDEVRAMARMRPMQLSITPFVFRLRAPDAPLSPSEEVTSAYWIPLAELLAEARRSTYEYVHQGSTLQFPCLRFDDFVIWGLTFRMFTSFRALVLEPDASDTPGAASA
jgi:8-oxo-dGTP pyrophosphatase MutT (NUDIX family)